MHLIIKWGLIFLITYVGIMISITIYRYKKERGKCETFLSWLTYRVNHINMDIMIKGVEKSAKIKIKGDERNEKIKRFFSKIFSKKKAK